MKASKALQQSTSVVNPTAVEKPLQGILESTIIRLGGGIPCGHLPADHLPEDAQWFGNGVVVEHRYIACIVQGIQDDGLAVQA